MNLSNFSGTLASLFFIVIVPCTSQVDSLSFPQKGATANRLSQEEKLLYLFGASVVYAGFDYVGFNITKSNPTALTIYRVLQVATQAAISWLLYDQVGLTTAISFNVIWWTFGDDILYYGYAELFNPGGGWESRGAFRNSIIGNQCTWAYWTPIGITRGIDRKKVIAGDTLIAQSLIGAILAVSLTLSF